MPYFIILPAFVLWVVVLAVAVLVASLYQPAVWLRPYLLSVLAWSSLGFVLSTLVYVGVLVGAVVAMDKLLAGKPSTIGGIAMAVVVFVGPFIAAGVGLFGGAIIAVRRIRRRLLPR